MSRLVEVLRRINNYQMSKREIRSGQWYDQENYIKAKSSWLDLIYPHGPDDLVYLGEIAAKASRFVQAEPLDANNMCIYCLSFVYHSENCAWEQLRESLK